MERILVLGTGPLLEASARVMSGQCLRTWHFCAPLLDAGHEVFLMTVPIPGATAEETNPPIEDAFYRDFPYRRFLSNNPARILPYINEAIEGMHPAAIVGINPYPAYLLAKLQRREPFWADLNGWTMGEGQVRASVLRHDRDFAHFWRVEAMTALVADRFSTVTARQADALYGELAMLGRLSHVTFAEPLTTVVANAVYPDYAELHRSKMRPAILDGKLPEDSRLVLWSGGFNSWTDIDLLIAGLVNAMERDPSICLVATGGAIHGHDEETYKRFLAKAEERLPAERWLALGWIDFPNVLSLHACAQVGLNIDGTNTETRFGARNRLTNMMGAGLPIVTTRGTEIAEWIERNDLGAVVPAGDAAAVGAALADAAAGGERILECAARAREAALRDFAPAATLKEFLTWAAKPVHAADRQTQTGGEPSPAALWREEMLRLAGGSGPLHTVEPSTGGEPSSIGGKLKNALRSFTGGRN